MCHTVASKFLPQPGKLVPFSGAVGAFVYGHEQAQSRIAILPDIFGCSSFYQGLSAHFAEKGARVFLVDPFAGLGELSESTREAAFARRNKISDRAFIDKFEKFAQASQITAVLGFCLGGLYVFELARRALPAKLVGLYGFPQGLPNQDPLPAPFDYLPTLRKRYTMLMGREDASVGVDNVGRLERLAKDWPVTELVVFDGVGHGFLAALDDEKGVAGQAARRALRICEAKLL